MFQTKCHNKIAELKQQGVTILYVSHNHGQVKKVCDRACWIQNGKLICVGNACQVSYIYDLFMSKQKTLTEIEYELKRGEYELY